MSVSGHHVLLTSSVLPSSGTVQVAQSHTRSRGLIGWGAPSFRSVKLHTPNQNAT